MSGDSVGVVFGPGEMLEIDTGAVLDLYRHLGAVIEPKSHLMAAVGLLVDRGHHTKRQKSYAKELGTTFGTRPIKPA